MYTFKTHNNIAQEGTDVLIENNFAINEVEPDALLIRSFILKEEKRIIRGAGLKSVLVAACAMFGITYI